MFPSSRLQAHMVDRTEASDGCLVVEVQTSVYSQETVLRAAHRFSGRYFIDVRNDTAGVVRVGFKPRSAQDSSGLEQEFRNELLDEELRAIVARESLLERNLILAHALSRHPVLQTEYESAEAFSDPLSVLTPDKR